MEVLYCGMGIRSSFAIWGFVQRPFEEVGHTNLASMGFGQLPFMSLYFSSVSLALSFSLPTCPPLSTNCLLTASTLSPWRGGSRPTCSDCRGRKGGGEERLINQRTLSVSQASTPKLHAGLHIGVRMNVNQRKHMGMQKRRRQKLSKEKRGETKAGDSLESRVA